MILCSLKMLSVHVVCVSVLVEEVVQSLPSINAEQGDGLLDRKWRR